MKKMLLVSMLLVVAASIASCNFNQAGVANGESPSAWIDAPLNGSSHPLGMLDIVAHGSDASGVAEMEMAINGIPMEVKAADDASQDLATFTWAWLPPGPGEYRLEARARSAAGSLSAPTAVVVTILGSSLGEILSTPTLENFETATPSMEPGCIGKATFLADVSIPDNTVFPPGSTFTKTWRLRNDGTCPWNEEYKVVFIGGDPMSNPTPVSIPGVVPPGATVDISLPLTAPTSAGTYRGDYQIRDPQGVHFGVGASGQTPMYVQIVVGRPTAPPPTLLPPSPTTTAPDTQPPSVSISHTPAEDWVPTSSPITFTANASDNVGVTRIEIWVTAPGQFPTLVKGCNNTTTCSFSGGPYPAGSLTYFAISRDAAGNEMNSGGKTITIYVVVS